MNNKFNRFDEAVDSIIFLINMNKILSKNRNVSKLIHDINNSLTFLKLESENLKNKQMEVKVDEIIQKIQYLSYYLSS